MDGMFRLILTHKMKMSFLDGSVYRLRTPIFTKQTQLCTRSNLKIVRQQWTISVQAEGRLAVIIYHYAG